MAEVILRKTGQSVLVDDEDVIHCKSLQMGRDGIIYTRWSKKGVAFRKGLHRLIMGEPKGFEVDHINGNRFDNRKENLRIATPSQNTCNRSRPNKKLLHAYRGIGYFDRPNLLKKYQARIKIKGKIYSGGYFLTAEQAARAYDELAKKHHGEFARLNFPEKKKGPKPPQD